MLVVSVLCAGFLGLSRAEYDAAGVGAHTYAVRGQSGVVFEAERPRAGPPPDRGELHGPLRSNTPKANEQPSPARASRLELEEHSTTVKLESRRAMPMHRPRPQAGVGEHQPHWRADGRAPRPSLPPHARRGPRAREGRDRTVPALMPTRAVRNRGPVPRHGDRQGARRSRRAEFAQDGRPAQRSRSSHRTCPVRACQATRPPPPPIRSASPQPRRRPFSLVASFDGAFLRRRRPLPVRRAGRRSVRLHVCFPSIPLVWSAVAQCHCPPDFL